MVDVNDNIFKFENLILVSVLEIIFEGIVVFIVIVVDRDVGFNGFVVYNIIVGNE